MKKLFSVVFALTLLCPVLRADPKRILLVTATAGFPHSSVSTAERVLTKLGETSKAYKIVNVVRSGPRPADKTEEKAWEEKMARDFAEIMSPTALNDYDGVIF